MTRPVAVFPFGFAEQNWRIRGSKYYAVLEIDRRCTCILFAVVDWRSVLTLVSFKKNIQYIISYMYMYMYYSRPSMSPPFDVTN